MAEAAVNQDTEIMAKEPGMFNQAGSLVSRADIRNPRFNAPSYIGCGNCGIVGLQPTSEA